MKYTPYKEYMIKRTHDTENADFKARIRVLGAYQARQYMSYTNIAMWYGQGFLDETMLGVLLNEKYITQEEYDYIIEDR